ncbi:LysM peptidoglycan-binding domain-containing protein [Gimesia aquarii]|uniref:LysM domain/BON superfamily protein n=1 Tax=Gimesia aquarii TaxID=2527964 RepID=A0A517VYK1_9PLAN|nr:LysM peptidoglycan-binding domain-containing protein [Gimesia aquarii]QDT98084.1 LysM domain/BON superfamily protein [Gimesia aquarii]
MHQDKKVGLALALLVLGFVGAFCLRQDNDKTVQIPELNDPHYLDEQIADKDRTPYFDSQSKENQNTLLGSEQTLSGIDDNQRSHSDSSVSTPTVSHMTSKKISNAERWAEMPDFLKEIDLPKEQFSNSSSEDSVFEPNPQQERMQPTSQGSISDSIHSGSENFKPQHNNAWEVNPSQQKPESRPQEPNRPSIRIHTVKSGETLSEIAIRYLGSSKKYREIFNLNRDRLRSPNDIREGMKLRIPVYGSSESKPQSANSQTFNGTSAKAGKRTIGQMVSQPTLKQGSSSVQFEGLIESLSNSQNKNTLKDLDHKKNLKRLEDTLKSDKFGGNLQRTKTIPDNYRKFIPVPRSPLTPRTSSRNSKQETKLGQSLSQVQPENVKQIIDGVFDESPEKKKQTGNRVNSYTYTIKKGDTLESIALRLYGKRSAAFQIYLKNKEKLKNADYIRPGMKLQLP